MPIRSDLSNAQAALETALKEAQAFEAEAIRAAEMAKLVGDSASKETFERARDRALVAMENWRKSAEFAQTIIFDISSRYLEK